MWAHFYCKLVKFLCEHVHVFAWHMEEVNSIVLKYTIQLMCLKIWYKLYKFLFLSVQTDKKLNRG